MAAEDTDIFLGLIVKAFGIKGEVKLVPSEDFWENALNSRRLFLVTETTDQVESGPVVLSGSRKHGEIYLLSIEGVRDRNAAENFADAELRIPISDIDVDMPEEALPFQIKGCRVITDDGVELGEVTALLYSPAHYIYEITGERGVNLVPAVPEFIARQDIENGMIVIKPIPGLLNEC